MMSVIRIYIAGLPTEFKAGPLLKTKRRLAQAKPTLEWKTSANGIHAMFSAKEHNDNGVPVTEKNMQFQIKEKEIMVKTKSVKGAIFYLTITMPTHTAESIGMIGNILEIKDEVMLAILHGHVETNPTDDPRQSTTPSISSRYYTPIKKASRCKDKESFYMHVDNSLEQQNKSRHADKTAFLVRIERF